MTHKGVDPSGQTSAWPARRSLHSLDSARLIDLIEGYALGYSAIGQFPPFAIRDEIARRLLALHDHAGAVTTNRQTRETLEVALNGRPEVAT